MVKIGLFANQGSEQLAEIAEAVRNAGAEAVVCDIKLGGQDTIVLGDQIKWGNVDFKDIKAVHVRCTSPRTLPVLPPVLNPSTEAEYRAQFVKDQEYNASAHAFFDFLTQTRRLVVNPLSGAYIDHDSKSQLYEKLRDWGFVAPRSLTTNSPEKAAAFLDMVGEAVVKPMIGVGSTRLVKAEDRERFSELELCPALFQERLPGDTIRIHIVADKVVLALRILADGNVDSRTDTKGFEEFILSPEEEAKIVKANQNLGLHYAAWDAIMGSDGRLAYLDCNPGPFVMWIGKENRSFVFQQLANYLITFARTGSIAEAAASVKRKGR